MVEKIEQKQQTQHDSLYLLPHPNPEIEIFIQTANIAKENSVAAKNACVNMQSNGDLSLSALPDEATIAITKAMLSAALSASQAQDCVCIALNEAISAGSRQKEGLKARIDQVNQEINDLNQKATLLRSSFNEKTNNSSEMDAYASAEAKQLLTCLETAYQKHEWSRRLHKQYTETNNNIIYLSESSTVALEQKHLLDNLLLETQNSWNSVATRFSLSPTTEATSLSPRATVNPETERINTGSSAQKKNQTDILNHLTEQEVNSIQEEKPSAGAIIWSYVKIVLAALLIALVLRSYIFDITRVEGTSMYDTLNDRDVLVTSKIAYLIDKPQRGDIVVLNAPDKPGDDYIKRVIGLPNEEILIENGCVYINNKLLDEPYLDGVDTLGDVHTIIPDGYYFVMGDNRGESRDSRAENVGVISIDDILGHAVFRLYPFSSIGSVD